jgi:hypothetical protein
MNAADFLASKAFEYAANFENKATKLKSDLEKIKRRERLVEFELDAARSAILRAHAFRGRIGTNFQCPRCWIHHKATTVLTPIADTNDIFVCSVCKAEYVLPLDR